MAMTSSEADGPGRLAKHSILVELGRGGMADVYLAVARGPADFHKLVVLKRLREDLARDPSFRDMALSEAKIAARLNHPNVVQTYEILNDGERPVIVMEYLEGQSLSSVLARVHDGTFALALRLRVLADALAGLHHAHELTDFDGRPFGLVHRDFTPHNIFIGYDGHVKVLDFGIAKTDANDTRSGTFKGKARYMSPEQIVGTASPDRRADVFSAGMVLWELAAGESPWKRTAEITIINRVINGELPSIRSVAPTIREDVEQICTKALQFDRDQRYATAAEMEAAVEQVLSTMTSRVAPRELGSVVASHFGDVRAATKRVIEEQLAKSDRVDATAVAPLVPFLHVGREPKVLAGADAARRSRQIWAGVSVAAAAGGCAAVFALLGRHTRTERLPAPDALSSAAEVSASAIAQAPSAPASEVDIHVRAIPPSAAIFFDEQRLPTNPAVLARVADGALHSVRAEARGYVSRTVQIVVDSGADLVLTLERGPSAPTSRVATERPSADSSTAPPAPPVDCNPPYYIDEQGIKKFKPRCI
jgi:tRNA A-37 threonylcarbamoyl transferase component Bud32